MSFTYINETHISCVCDKCGEESGSREEKKLIRKGWVIIKNGVEKYAYCPECADKLDAYQKLNGGKNPKWRQKA